MSSLGLVDDPSFSAHKADGPHPERPERLDAARAGVARAVLGPTRVELGAREASDDELVRVHGAAYLESLGRVAGKRGHLDADTYFGPDSIRAARRAAGGGVVLTDALLDGRVDYGLALVRPPGHHARPDAAMGFCLLNNVAVAAAHARARGLSRVMVVDWDVHHGNGTQEMFYADPSVLYLSLHQSPFYPGTGACSELGSGEGTGYTVNVPLGVGATDATYLAAFDRIVAPIVEQYDPDLLLVSAGFDAHQRDPLASMQLTDDAYPMMTAALMRALPRGAAGRFALFLEGGYDLSALSSSLSATLASLEDGERPALHGSVGTRHAEELAAAERALEPHWKLS